MLSSGLGARYARDFKVESSPQETHSPLEWGGGEAGWRLIIAPGDTQDDFSSILQAS